MKMQMSIKRKGYYSCADFLHNRWKLLDFFGVAWGSYLGCPPLTTLYPHAAFYFSCLGGIFGSKGDSRCKAGIFKVSSSAKAQFCIRAVMQENYISHTFNNECCLSKSRIA